MKRRNIPVDKDDTVITSFPLDEIVKVLLNYVPLFIVNYRLSFPFSRKPRVLTLKSSLERCSQQGMHVMIELWGQGTTPMAYVRSWALYTPYVISHVAILQPPCDPYHGSGLHVPPARGQPMKR